MTPQDTNERPRGNPSPGEDPSPLSQHTWPHERASSDRERGAKAARVRTLTDPLGARGFRATGARIRAETSARRKVLLASVAAFAASFGVIVATNQVSTTTDADPATTQPAAVAGGDGALAAGVASGDGPALDTFGLPVTLPTSETRLLPTATATATMTPTTTSNAAVAADDHEHDDDEEDDGDHHEDDDHEDDESGWLTSAAGDTGASQVTTSGQSSQPSTSQQPSHTRSGGS